MVYRTPTHGISTPYPWYIDLPSHGILTPLYPRYIDPLSMVYRPPTHGISTPLPKVFYPYTWYIDPASHGISTSYPWSIDP